MHPSVMLALLGLDSAKASESWFPQRSQQQPSAVIVSDQGRLKKAKQGHLFSFCHLKSAKKLQPTWSLKMNTKVKSKYSKHPTPPKLWINMLSSIMKGSHYSAIVRIRWLYVSVRDVHQKCCQTLFHFLVDWCKRPVVMRDISLTLSLDLISSVYMLNK